MNAGAILRAAEAGHPGAGAGRYRDRHRAIASSGLWVFMGVATSLFSLFIAAYVMRMDGADWHPIGMPRQLWLSTAFLVVGSAMLQWASVTARSAGAVQARIPLLAGGACALAFLGVQLWAWQVMQAMHVVPAGSPAGSFFYLLTAMHGLHVAGGIAGWGLAVRSAWRDIDAARVTWHIELCARYWHFLLAVWVVLFAALGWLTPELVRYICGTR